MGKKEGERGGKGVWRAKGAVVPLYVSGLGWLGWAGMEMRSWRVEGRGQRGRIERGEARSFFGFRFIRKKRGRNEEGVYEEEKCENRQEREEKRRKRWNESLVCYPSHLTLPNHPSFYVKFQ